jgi:hypothetical protein
MTPAPFASASAPDAWARAATVSAVISPLKRETASTSDTACATALPDGRANALDERAPVRTAEPSAGYANPSAAPAEAGPGADASAVAAPGWPGSTTVIPNAPAETTAGLPGTLAPVAAAARAPASKKSEVSRRYTRPLSESCATVLRFGLRMRIIVI